MPKKSATATESEAEQTQPETKEAQVEEVQATDTSGEQPKEEDKLGEMERQLQELQQGLSSRDIKHKAEIERLQREAGAETERRVTQAVLTRDARHSAETRQARIALLKQRAKDGDEEAVEELAVTANEPQEQARIQEETNKLRGEAELMGFSQGYTTLMNRRLNQLTPTEERYAELNDLWDKGKFEELETEMAKDETVKAGGASAERINALEKRITELQGTLQEANTEEAAQEARAKGGGDLGGGAPAGGRPTPEQWAAMSTIERNKARAEGRGPTE